MPQAQGPGGGGQGDLLVQLALKTGKVTEAQVEEIANTKMPDLNAVDIEAAKSIIKGTARSMGIEVEG